MRALAIFGKGIVCLVKEIVNMALLTSIMSMLAFACYAMWDSNEVHRTADSSRYEKYKPTAENAGASFEELRAINPEVFAWLTVFGTHIDYPVVQSHDNMKYVNTNALGNHSLSGAIFLDSRNSKDFSDFDNIIYGHHMEKQTMFGEIGQFSEKEYFDARRYGSMYFDGQEHGLEFFAFIHTSAYNDSVYKVNITELDEQQAYLDMLLGIASHTRNEVQVTVEDRFVLLTTCSETTTNGRDILLGRIIGEVHSDPFE